MTSYVEKTQNMLKTDTENYNFLFWWQGDNILFVEDMIEFLEDGTTVHSKKEGIYKNSDVVVQQIREFVEKSKITISEDQIKSLISFVLCYVKVVSDPNIMTLVTKDPDGVYDFKFSIENDARVIKTRKLKSKPKNDMKFSKFPRMSSSSVQSFVGINYDPRSKLIQIRYKLYPQKISWGIRYNPKFKPFDDLLELLHLDLVQYASEDLTELSANKQKESEEPEDLEAREIRESSAELEDEFNRS